MTRISRAVLTTGMLMATVLAGAKAHAAVTTYALPGQAGVYKNPANDPQYWTNTYGRMMHGASAGTNELDFPLTAVAGSTLISGFVNVDVAAPTVILGLTAQPQACAQMLALDLPGTSVLSTPVQCQLGPVGGVTGVTLNLGSLMPGAQFYSFVAVWATFGVKVNSVSYALTK